MYKSVILILVTVSSFVVSKSSWWQQLQQYALLKQKFENAQSHFDMTICNEFFETPTQRRICRNNVKSGNAYGLVNALDNAIHLAIRECHHQFRGDKWNCPLEWRPSEWEHGFSPDSLQFLENETKEAAFLIATLSAALAHSVAHACAVGNLTDCSCRQTMDQSIDQSSIIGFTSTTMSNILSKSSIFASIQESSSQAAASAWQWSGCSENVRYGSFLSRKFLDPPALSRLRRDSGDLLAIVHLQNLLLGRKSLASQLRVNCKCHGLSASCSVKTCFRQPSPFRKVAYTIRQKYDKAVLATDRPELVDMKKELSDTVTQIQVTEQDQKQQPDPVVNSRLFKRKTKQQKKESLVASNSKAIMHFLRSGKVFRETLLHFNKSPNFCEPTPQFPSSTSGRECTISPSSNATSGHEYDAGSCDVLCCGRGVDVKLIYVAESCRCEFKWCCEIKCETCWTTREVVTCK